MQQSRCESYTSAGLQMQRALPPSDSKIFEIVSSGQPCLRQIPHSTTAPLYQSAAAYCYRPVQVRAGMLHTTLSYFLRCELLVKSSVQVCRCLQPG